MDNNIIEISNLDWNTNENSSSLKSANFGDGVELLMNDRIKNSGGSSKVYNDINIDDLNNLEDELNSININDISSNSYDSKPSFFDSSNKEDKPFVRFGDSMGETSNETNEQIKTWDGYSKFNNIPLNPDKGFPKEPQFSKEELLKQKFKYLRKLEALEKKGVELSTKYSMESPLAEMQGEYETIMDEKSKQNSIKFQGNMLMACINGIEFLNNKFDPFDIKLDGWGEQLNENINDYDDIFSELFDKYKSKASMAPELKLLFQLGGSAMMIHMTNTMFKSAMPGVDDILRQNPDLLRQFQSAAVNSMSQTSPGFSGFVNNVMKPSNNDFAGPPAPIFTQGPNAVSPPTTRPGNNNSHLNDGINFKETTKEVPAPRTEMKGPSDINEILSRLKTKNINIQESKPSFPDNNSSTISINDLKEIQEDSNIPKRSKRKPRSDKNTISLDF